MTKTKTAPDKPLVVVVRSQLELGPEWPLKVRAAVKRALDYPNPLRQKMIAIGKKRAADALPYRIEHWTEREDGTLLIPRGATAKVRDACRAAGVVPMWSDERRVLPPVDFDLGPDAVRLPFWDHQDQMIEAGLRTGHCLILAATGGGKTDAALELVRKLRQPTLVVVWKQGLVSQWVERICLRWGWDARDIGVIGGGKRRRGLITIALQQSLNPDRCAQLDPFFGCVILDECQRAAARTVRDTVGSFSAKYRFGLSASEKRKDRMQFLTYDIFGPVAVNVGRIGLEKKKILCPVDFVLLPTRFTMPELEEAAPEDRLKVRTQLYAEYMDRITEDAERSEQALGLAADLVRKGEVVMIYCNRIALAKEMAEFMTHSEGIRCGLMIGGPENRQVFESTRAGLTNGTLKCAVGSSAIYEGEDIPPLTAGIVVTPTGSNQQLLDQQVGRLRRRSKGKQKARLYYLWDEHVVPDHLDNFVRWYGKDAVMVARTEIPK